MRKAPMHDSEVAGADLALALGDHPLREEAEEQLAISALASLLGPTAPRRRNPEAAPHVGHDVRQLFLGALAVPAFGLQPERQVLALAVGAEAERVAAPALPVALHHLAFRSTSHSDHLLV